MLSVTIEFQRFGDTIGILRESERYIRTVGTTAPADEVQFQLEQACLVDGMRTLDYGLFDGPGDPEKIRENSARFLSGIKAYLEEFLPTAAPPGCTEDRYQVEVVTRALELAQLPFEVLASSHVEITRRIRQPWPPPLVNHSNTPKILFAWASPRKSVHSQSRMRVPHERHSKLLDEQLSDWGGIKGSAVTELKHVTQASLSEALGDPDHGFTHVHLLAHGIGPPRRDPAALFDINKKPEPSTFLALENEDGTIDRCSPANLGTMLKLDVPRPASFAIATCHSAEVDPIESGGTLAHIIHAAGVPVVVASQLALTQVGSDQLIKTFLRKVINGDDPRVALGQCRDALREKAEETYYDNVALIGYIHVDDGLEQRLPGRKFAVALARLNAASKQADKRVGDALPIMGDSQKGLSQAQRVEAEQIEKRFASVRDRLAELEPDPTLSKAEREELNGLQASSLKREAEAAWKLSQVLSGNDAETWRSRSKGALREAARAYSKAASWSRDHHWTWVQWLVLEAVVHGTLDGLEEDWIVSKAAATDAVKRQVPEYASDRERIDIQDQAIWAHGSLMELCLLSPLVGRGDALAEARKHLDELVKGCIEMGDEFPIASTLNQLNRYEKWWGADSEWPLPSEVVEQAKELYSFLKAHQTNK